MKIFFADTPERLELPAALVHLTDERISRGSYCHQTVKDLRDACKILLDDRRNLIRLGDRAARALITEGTRTVLATELADLVNQIRVRE